MDPEFMDIDPPPRQLLEELHQHMLAASNIQVCWPTTSPNWFPRVLEQGSTNLCSIYATCSNIHSLYIQNGGNSMSPLPSIQEVADTLPYSFTKERLPEISKEMYESKGVAVWPFEVLTMARDHGIALEINYPRWIDLGVLRAMARKEEARTLASPMERYFIGGYESAAIDNPHRDALEVIFPWIREYPIIGVLQCDAEQMGYSGFFKLQGRVVYFESDETRYKVSTYIKDGENDMIISHAVSIVGFVQVAGGRSFYIYQDSQGPEFGFNGFCAMGIECFAYMWRCVKGVDIRNTDYHRSDNQHIRADSSFNARPSSQAPSSSSTRFEDLINAESGDILLVSDKFAAMPGFHGIIREMIDAMKSDSRNSEPELVGETKFGQSSDVGSHEDLHNFVSEKEKSFYSQASDLGIEMARESHALSPETCIVEESRPFDGTSIEALRQPAVTEREVHESSKETKLVDSGMPPVQQTATSNSKAKKQKGKNNQGPGPNSPSPFHSTDSSNEVGGCSSITSDSVVSQILAMQESINQLMGVQGDLQKQMNAMVTVPVTKEVKKLEAALGKHTEKAVKANSDALWARFLEEHVKQEKSSRERTNLINNCLNKDLPDMLEKTVKKEMGSVSQAVARTIAPTIEKAVTTAITEAFQKGVVDKAVSQLEKSITAKLEPTVARQIQVLFQTSGKKALQETMKPVLESSLIPAFESVFMSMLKQIDATFQKGFAEHATAALQQVESSHLPLAVALRDTINSASSMTQSLSGELADGHRKLLAVALVSQLTNGPLAGLHEKIEAPVDPMKELSRLVAERKYEEAFNAALQRSDVSIVSWLCSQVDLPKIMMINPVPLSQGVLLSLLQQISCDINQDPMTKLGWMREFLGAIEPADQMIAVHVRSIFDQVYQILHHHRNLPTTSPAEQSSIRIIMHVIHSMCSK